MELLDCFLQLIFVSSCCIHCYTDWKYMLLYDETNIILMVAGVMRQALFGSMQSAILGGLVVGGIFLLIYYIGKGGMGLGDVKLAVVLGVWLGWQQGCVCLLLALWLGCIIGVGLICLGKRNAKDAIAFGPYMCMAGVIMLYYGERIILFYANLF